MVTSYQLKENVFKSQSDLANTYSILEYLSRYSFRFRGGDDTILMQ